MLLSLIELSGSIAPEPPQGLVTLQRVCKVLIHPQEPGVGAGLLPLYGDLGIVLTLGLGCPVTDKLAWVGPACPRQAWHCAEVTLLPRPPSLCLSLGSNGFHGLPNCLFISQELHGLGGLQILVQLIHDGDSSGQVQFHDGLF